MGTNNQTKEARQQEKDAYYKKVLGDVSLIDEDPAKQKKILLLESERLSRLVAFDSSSNAVSGDCNKLLNEAGVLLKDTNLDRNAVFVKIDKVKQRLLQAYESRDAQPNLFSPLFSVNFLYLFCIAFTIIWFKLIPGQDRLQDTAWVCLACAMWGGIGSIVDVFWAMHTHFSQQDFDRHYMAWYMLHPLLGLSLGAVVFLVMQAGLLTLSGTPLQETAAANVTAISVQDIVAANVSAISPVVTATGKIGVTALPIALAFLAGFRQRTVVDFLTRIVKAVFQKE